MCTQFDFKVIYKKTLPKKEDHLIFLNCGWRSLLLKKTPKEEKFDVWTSQSCGFHETRGWIFYGSLKIVWLLPQVFVLYFLRK